MGELYHFLKFPQNTFSKALDLLQGQRVMLKIILVGRFQNADEN
jgi:hypothetical protein